MKKIFQMKCFYVIVTTLLLGLAFFVGYIYSGLQFIPPHFHANFAMYVDGERVDFSLDKYQEDIAGCSLTGDMYPEARVHLHENNQDTIHIHHEGVAWGHFFSNNGFVFGSDFLITDTGEKLGQIDESKVTYILNGEVVENPFNDLIKSEDRLLINYGSEGENALQRRYEQVSSNAGDYNAKYDPGSCGGTNENGIVVLIHELLGHKH